MFFVYLLSDVCGWRVGQIFRQIGQQHLGGKVVGASTILQVRRHPSHTKINNSQFLSKHPHVNIQIGNSYLYQLLVTGMKKAKQNVTIHNVFT
jgi:hypothetical protein